MTLDEVRALIATLPETQARDEFSGLTWRVRSWILARLTRDRESLMIAEVHFDERDLLVELDPETFWFHPDARDHRVVWAKIASLQERMSTSSDTMECLGAIQATSLAHGLLSDFTAFVAVCHSDFQHVTRLKSADG